MNLVNLYSVQTMSSQEIADLVDKRHDNVKRTIESLSVREVIQHPQIEEVKNHLGQAVQVYQICKRDTFVIVAQLSPEFTARLVDRWQELEAQQAPSFIIPNTLSSALMLAAKQAEQIEQQQAALSLAAPKVEHFDAYVARDGLRNLTDVAKSMGLSAVMLGRLLREHGMAFKRTDKMVWSQWFIDKGYGTMKQVVANNKDRDQPMITNLGDAYIKSQFYSDGEL